jgi:hypothetical protein
VREATNIEGYFDLCKHLFVLDVIVGLASVVMLSWGSLGNGLFDALVLGAFFASFVFALRAMPLAVEGITDPRVGVERTLRRRLALAAGSFLAGFVGIVSYASVLFLA